jgi:tRNA pseudouridine55 synthase
MNGLLIIDKPEGITSHDVVRQVRRLFGMRRVGHCGTLDPLATGLLQVAIGEGTRVVEFLMEGEKTYRATLKLGETTTTQDAEGETLDRRPVIDVSQESVITACRKLTGAIQQVPPMYSALKRGGVPLHRLARQGIVIERPPRQVYIHRLEVLQTDLPFLTIEVDCSKGTYIRTLCHDLGMLLGCGAHLTALRRVRSGSFTEKESVPLDRLEAIATAGKCPPLLTMAEALRSYPALQVVPAAARVLKNGVPPSLPEIAGVIDAVEGDVVTLHQGDTLLAVARFAPSRVREKRGDFELLRVFNQHESQ